MKGSRWINVASVLALALLVSLVLPSFADRGLGVDRAAQAGPPRLAAAGGTAEMATDRGEKDARKDREHTGAGARAASSASDAIQSPPAGTMGPFESRAAAINRYGAQTPPAGGPVSGGVLLSLAAPDRPYVYGPPYYLYLALTNKTSSRQVLDAMPACGSLARTDTLQFRVTSETGATVVVGNSYLDNDAVHAHGPLTVDGGATLADVVNLTDLVALSPALLAMSKASRSLTVIAEVPALQLQSNAITISVGPNA